MMVKGIIDEDFVNYKKPSMFIAFPYCSFKCEKECGIRCCQNNELALSPNINISVTSIVERYIANEISSSIVVGGLEPFDSFDDLITLVQAFRTKIQDDIVIYTGYTETEVASKLCVLNHYSNIIVKFGRFVPNDTPRYDDLLGIKLASKNQYAIKLS